MATEIPTIEQLIDAVIDREGGYSNHPADRGGPTRFGITESVARANGYPGDMRNFPRADAVSIYRRLYWLRPALDKVAARYPAIAAELFDVAVNMGVGTAAGFLQRCLNALNRGGSDYADVVLDSSIGPATLRALDGFVRGRGADGEAVLLYAVRSLRGARYIEISEGRPANEAFTYGWFGRMVEMVKARFK